ncbi:sensor domain-containing diguanylate cyclase [Elioraea tepida]|jgi:diguanylate cyclase (GGDEF)-like protein/PAS domain S-box-containing protein|uniref:Sensor domain-containing diguanylate cyclase n=1 Tax=Elioraea tepida TaxID=2843330 RepID=A0A975YJ80_9PROT|nr:sensor domain-containing diguanylate cyclase [Elioraea tepida]QXM24369.1 sensor domain-containing diguanylate cyclase [Elioraea tepida]
MDTGIEAGSMQAVLRDALLDSRQRWRDLVEMAADLAWETDAEGRLTFVAPDPALGWRAAELLGQPAEVLLAPGDGGAPPFSPFRVERQRRGVRAWLRRADGSLACMSFAGVPLFGPDGQIAGARGVARDVTEEEERNAALAAALRREALTDAVLEEARAEVLADGMLAGAARALLPAIGAAGVAVLRRSGAELIPLVTLGDSLPGLVALAARAAKGASAGPRVILCPEGRPVLVAPARQPGQAEGLLLLWRAPGGRAWDEEEHALARAAADVIGIMLAHQALQAEMFRQARTDPLTGLMNRRAFLEEVSRRLDRLDRERRPGALFYIDLDNFKPVNDRLGHEAGDAALRAAAELLRGAVRPTDLVARLGGDEFAIWLDGADETIAARRAERLLADAPLALAHVSLDASQPLSFSIGIAVRAGSSGEGLSHMIVRADTAMYAAKRAGKSAWSLAPA